MDSLRGQPNPESRVRAEHIDRSTSQPFLVSSRNALRDETKNGCEGDYDAIHWLSLLVLYIFMRGFSPGKLVFTSHQKLA